MNIGMNGVLVLHHSFLMLLISVFFFPSLYSFLFPFTQNRGYPYTQRVFIFYFPDTQPFQRDDCRYEACGESQGVRFWALWHQCVMAMVAQCKIEMRQCD